MHVRVKAVLALGAWAVAGPALAAPPSAESIALARTLALAADTGGIATMNGLALPIPRLMTEMGITDRTHFSLVVHEDVMPVLNDHSDRLTDIQAASYAALLTPADLKAAIAFYQSPTGQKLVKLRFKLLQTNMEQADALVQKLKPAITVKVQDTLKAHGWTKS